MDMIKAGIIDPLKVIRTALVDAARYTKIENWLSNFVFYCNVLLIYSIG